MPAPEQTPPPEPQLDNDLGSLLTLLLMIAALAVLGYSGLTLFTSFGLTVPASLLPAAQIELRI